MKETEAPQKTVGYVWGKPVGFQLNFAAGRTTLEVDTGRAGVVTLQVEDVPKSLESILGKTVFGVVNDDGKALRITPQVHPGH